MMVLLVCRLGVYAQSGASVVLETQAAVLLKKLKPVTEDYQEPFVRDYGTHLYYAYRDANRKHHIELYHLDKQKGRHFKSLKLQLPEAYVIDMADFFVLNGEVYIIGAVGYHTEIVRFTHAGSNSFKLTERRTITQRATNNRVFIISDSMLCMPYFYYNNENPSLNLSFFYYNFRSGRVHDSSAYTFGTTAFSSVYPQWYFYARHDTIYFMDPASGIIAMKTPGQELRKPDKVSLSYKALSGIQQDTLQWYSIGRGIMPTFWKLQEYREKDSICYLNFIYPLPGKGYLLSLRSYEGSEWHLLDTAFKDKLRLPRSHNIYTLDKDDYFAYYFTPVEGQAHQFSSLRVGRKKQLANKHALYGLLSFRKYYLYSTYTVHVD